MHYGFCFALLFPTYLGSGSNAALPLSMFHRFSLTQGHAFYVFMAPTKVHFFAADFTYISTVKKEEAPSHTLLGQRASNFSVPVTALQMLGEQYAIAEEYFVLLDGNNQRNIGNASGETLLKESVQHLEKISSNAFLSFDPTTYKQVLIEL